MRQPKSNAQLLIALDKELKEKAMAKSRAAFNIGLSTLLKLFIKAFVDQKNVGFYLGDDDFNTGMRQLIFKKRLTRMMTERRKLIREDRG